ncbi:hypothetical protein H4R99_007524, partial [Coemansia sp. RSA 1722]
QPSSVATDYTLGALQGQLNEYQGVLSTPASSARLSTSSLSLLAMTPSLTNQDGISTGDTSRRQSSDDQKARNNSEQQKRLSGVSVQDSGAISSVI